MCTERLSDIFRQMDEDDAMCEIAALPVNLYTSFLRDACLVWFPFGCRGVIAWPNSEEEAPTLICPMAVLRWECCFLWIFNISLSSIKFWGLFGGCTVLYSCICICRMRNFFPGVSKSRSLKRAVLKGSDTPNMAALTVPWSSFVFLVVPNYFCWTNYVKEYRSLVLSSCDIPSRNFALALVWVRKVYHRYQFLYCLAAVVLYIHLVASIILVAKISRR